MRVKRGVTKRQRHKKVLKLTKGFRMTYSKSYRRAKEAVMHAGQYEYAHRRHKRGQMRLEWIKIISAGLASTDLSYSKFIAALKKNEISLDRKTIAEMAVNSPASFTKLVEQVK
jgi:large subunit ribosomal protein L20